MSPELMGRIFALRALAQAFLNEFDRLEQTITETTVSATDAYERCATADRLAREQERDERSADATDDRLNAEVQRKIAETYPPGEIGPVFSTEIAEPTPEQLERVRRRQKDQQQPKPTPELTPVQKANLKLVKDYIRANSDGGEHVE